MKGFLFLSLCFLLSFSAIAESPPGFEFGQKIEMKSTCPLPVAFDAPSLEAIEADGNTAYVLVEVHQLAPALLLGNTLRSCGQNANLNISTDKATTINAPNGQSSNADFKVGWQGESISK